MNDKLPLIKTSEDLNDPRARSLILKYDLSVEKLLDLEQKLYERGNFKISPFTVEKSSIIKELIATAILNFELTKNNIFLIPYYDWSHIINGQKIYLFSFVVKREISIESYESSARNFLKYAKGLERCEISYYFRPFLRRLPKTLYATIRSISRRCDRTPINKT